MNQFSSKAIDISISKGIDFLYKNQTQYGEFRTYISDNKEMKIRYYNCPGSSPYITTFVLYSINFLEDRKVTEMTQKSLDFFLKEMEESGVWSFYTKNNRRLRYFNGLFIKEDIGIIPDLDDTACVSYCLTKNHITFPSNIEILLKNKSKNKLFYTWFLDDDSRIINSKNDLFIYIPPANDTCLGVNANILLYLGENNHIKPVCDFINEIILNEQEEKYSVYFPDMLVLYYLLTRAYFNGVTSLKKSCKLIKYKILSNQSKHYFFKDVLSTALQVCILFNCEYFSSFIHESIGNIIDAQAESGSWEKKSFFIEDSSRHYGSEELTTAICIEALSRYSAFLRS